MKDLLIVEDDPTLGEGIRLALQAPELRPQLCRSLADAGELLSRRSFDLLILDLNLPGMDGLEILRRLRADPATATWRQTSWQVWSWGRMTISPSPSLWRCCGPG